MGFVSLEKEDLQKKKPYAMGKKELQQALDANIKEQQAVRDYYLAIRAHGGSKKDIETARQIWLALKTMHTQLEGLHRRAR